MNLADVSIRRPIFITCVVLVMLALGLMAIRSLGVDLFPNVTFPVVTVTTAYPGAGPAEIETLVSKPLEDEISTLSGIKRLSSRNFEGRSVVIAEFTLETDVKYAEQQIRDRVGGAKRKLPEDIEEPIIRRIDPSDQPVVILAVQADLPDAKLYDLANETIRPKIEQVNQVGLVEVIGGRKREIHVALDRDKLKSRELSVTAVAQRLAAAGENVPAGKVEKGAGETVIRTLGQFGKPDEVGSTLVSFYGSDVPTTIRDVGTVEDTLVDETSRAFVNGKKSLFLYVFRQSGSNTISVVEAVKKAVGKINADSGTMAGKPQVTVVRDGAVWIRANVLDVEESITIGIVLAVIVVFFFLGSGRSTIITGLALPNSLIGAFLLMQYFGFTINIMTLLALSLSVGLLVDDAIVVRENIFRHIEMGKPPKQAALEGTGEVRLAVIATTLTVIAVFGPVAFLKGIVGQFFREFGLTICFAMMISLFDALTIAPMLSAYFAGTTHGSTNPKSLGYRTIGVPLRAFERFQTWLENGYVRLLGFTIRRPIVVLGASFLIFLGSCASLKAVPKTFLPAQDAGEFSVAYDLPPGSNLGATADLAAKIDDVIRKNPEVEVSALTVGGRNGESNVGEFYVKLVGSKQRSMNTSEFKQRLREQLAPYASANPIVKDYDAIGGGMRPFNVNIVGFDEAQLEKFGLMALERLKKHPGLKDVDINFRPGKPEFQVTMDPSRSKSYGISTRGVGGELRAQVEGLTPARLRENGVEYDIRVRLKPEQRDLKASFDRTYVPNVNSQLVRLADIARPVNASGPSAINRQDRARYVQIGADMAPGAGMAAVMDDIRKMFETDVKLPEGVTYRFVGQAEDFQDLMSNMLMAMGFGILFIFLVLASLYESFVTPWTIMLALPLALAGAFVALAVTGQSLNIFSMIGTVMLLGVSVKNSILLVDYANQQIQKGMSRKDALIAAGRTRLRPILMTTMALIAGTIPIALGLNEASRQRTSMGVAIIGGLISSTLLTLVVVPAAFSYIDRFRLWSQRWMARIFAPKGATQAHGSASGGSGDGLPLPAKHSPTDF